MMHEMVYINADKEKIDVHLHVNSDQHFLDNKKVCWRNVIVLSYGS